MKRLLCAAIVLFTLPAAGSEPYATLRYRLEMGLPVVEVAIGGVHCEMIFDTGSSHTVVTDRVARSVGTGRVKKGRIYGLRTVIEIGEQGRRRRLRVRVMESDNLLFRCSGTDGIIGMDLLAKYTVGFDHAAGTITLYRRMEGEEGLQWHPMRLDRHRRPYFTGEIVSSHGRSAETLLFFDSGNGREALVFTPEAAGRLLPLVDSLETASGLSGMKVSGAGPPRTVFRGQIAGLRVGGMIFGGIPVVEGHGNVEQPYLPVCITAFGRLVMDFPGRRYAFVPYPGISPGWSLPRQRVQAMVRDGRIVVSAVWEESLKEVVRQGDTIEKVGDTVMERRDECRNRGLDRLVKEFATPENYTVSVRAGDGTLHILPAELFIDF